MNGDPIQSPPSTGLVSGGTFRAMLFLMAVSCFVQTIGSTYDRLQFSLQGVPATIEIALRNQKAPTVWTDYEGHPRSVFDVRVKTSDGQQSFANLFLRKDVIDKLMKGERGEIIFIRNNPRRFLMKGDPLPPFDLGWTLGGLIVLAVFLYSLKLR